MASQGLIDTEVTKKMKYFANIAPEHLEIPPGITSSNTYERAIQDLQKVSHFKSPKDKLTMIVNACKLVNGMVWENSKNKAIPSGADDFLPVLIFMTIKACPCMPNTHLNYLRELRSTELLKGFADYYLTAYESVLDFIERLDKSRLKITPEEYEGLFVVGDKDSDLFNNSKEIDLVITPGSKTPPVAGLGSGDSSKILDLEIEKGPKGKLQWSPETRASSEKSDEALGEGLTVGLSSRAIDLSNIKDYLYANNKKNIKFEDRKLGGLFVDQLDSFFYEYKTVLKNYKKLSETVEQLIEKSPANVESNTYQVGYNQNINQVIRKTQNQATAKLHKPTKSQNFNGADFKQAELI
jgi:hypothetical protein